MANKAMKDRHWERMAKLTGHTFDFDSEGFTLRDIMKAPLLKYKEDIEVQLSQLYFIPSSVQDKDFSNVWLFLKQSSDKQTQTIWPQTIQIFPILAWLFFKERK